MGLIWNLTSRASRVNATLRTIICKRTRHLRRLLLTVALLLAGCAALPTPVVLNGDVPSFPGMSALVEEAPRRPLHVLLVHGMGTPQPYGFDAFIGALAGRFGFVQVPRRSLSGQYQGCYNARDAGSARARDAAAGRYRRSGRCPENQARLYTYDFGPPGSDRTALTVSYLLWTPLTEAVKCRLEDEDASAPQKQAFADFTKDFIDDKLADAVLYSGSYRQRVLRLSLQGALCKVTGGKWTAGECAPHGPDYRDPTVIITHSLGGYMIMDAIQSDLRCKLAAERRRCAHARREGSRKHARDLHDGEPARAARSLDIATRSQHVAGRPGHPGRETSPMHFAKCWAAARARSAAREGSEPRLSVRSWRSAIPNDILSWRLEPRNLQFPHADWGEVAVTNVYHVEQRVQHPGRDLGPGERPHRLLRQPDGHRYVDLRHGERRAATMPDSVSP